MIGLQPPRYDASPEDQRRAPATVAAREIGLAGLARANQQRAEAPLTSASGTKLEGILQTTMDLLKGPLGEHIDDPSFRKAAETYDEFLNGGKQPEGVTREGLYDFGTKLFVRELQTGVGSKLPDGSTITGKRIVSAYQRGDDVILELDISARKPDGAPFNYRAPVTKNRTHEDTDEVLQIPIEQIRERIKGLRYLAKAVDMAGGRDAVLRQLGQHLPDPDAAINQEAR